MPRRQTDPLRALTPEEQAARERLSRSQREPASHVARATALLAVAAGQTYTAAAHAAGRRSGDAVAHLVARFNQQGLAASVPGHGGGPPPTYTVAERTRILAEARRPPDRERDGTATWSRMTLRRALRTALDGRPKVSTGTIRAVLIDAGWRWHRSRSWCDTGTGQRTRKSGGVTVIDPDAEAKKSCLSGRIPRGSAWDWRCGAKLRRGHCRPCRTQGQAGCRRDSPCASPTRTSATGLLNCSPYVTRVLGTSGCRA